MGNEIEECGPWSPDADDIRKAKEKIANDIKREEQIKKEIESSINIKNEVKEKPISYGCDCACCKAREALERRNIRAKEDDEYRRHHRQPDDDF